MTRHFQLETNKTFKFKMIFLSKIPTILTKKSKMFNSSSLTQLQVKAKAE